MPKHSTSMYLFVLVIVTVLGLVSCTSKVPDSKVSASGITKNGVSDHNHTEQINARKRPAQSINNAPDLSLKTARFSHATASDGQKLYVFAGYGKKGFLTDVEIIDPRSGKIEVLKVKVLPRQYFSAVWDGKHSIYLVGGISLIEDSVALEPRMEIFDTITHQVTFAPSVEVPKHDSSAVYLDGRIYLFGGSDYSPANGFELIPSTQATSYDIATQTWLPLADMPTAKSTSVFVKDNKIYALGGSSYLSPLAVFEQYNPVNNSWQILANAPQPIAAHSLALHEQKLLIFGSDDHLDLTYSYDFGQEKWQKTNIGYLPSTQNTATLVGDTIYVIGGTAGKGQVFLNHIQPFPQ